MSNKLLDSERPTNRWLEPIKVLKNINNYNIIMLAKLLNNKEVIVKITKTDNYNRIKMINDLINKLPNMIHVYMTFQCNEDESNLETDYNQIKGYCYGNQNDKHNIVLEITKNYSKSLSKYINKLSLDRTKIILKQLIFAQLHAFYNTGFLHMNIHIGNFLINNNKVDLKYSFNKINIDLSSEFEIKLTDFNDAIIYNPSITSLIPYYYYNSLIFNIINTFNECYKLISIHHLKIMKNLINSLEVNTIKREIEILKSYYNKQIDYKTFISKIIDNNMIFINKIWNKLYTENINE